MAKNNKVTKADLVAILADSFSTSKINTDRILNTILDTIVDLVCDGKEIKLTGFGTFQKSIRKPRAGVNPKTKDKIIIPGYASAGFRVGKNFKEAVRDSGEKGLLKK
jgi:DNA-binding protein HU-beta